MPRDLGRFRGRSGHQLVAEFDDSVENDPKEALLVTRFLKNVITFSSGKFVLCCWPVSEVSARFVEANFRILTPA